jgi:hypothetical protein
MKGKKFRYDEKKLSKSSSLKKQMALFLAKEMYATKGKDTIDVVETLAFGLKIRPLVSYSDKELIRLFDESYSKKFETIKELEEEYQSNTGNVARWYKDTLKKRIEQVNATILEMQPVIDELIEEAFSS